MNAEDIKIRTAEPSDHARIIAVMPDWWGGRDLTHLLPDWFLVHFCDTSFVVEQGAELIGFLMGFMSQAYPNMGYVNLIGVHPDHRKERIGEKLYQAFFKVCLERGRPVARAHTSLINTGSIAFHTRLGFQVEYGEKRAFFTKHLA